MFCAGNSGARFAFDLFLVKRFESRAGSLRMGREMALCLRDFRRASSTPTQVASSVATARYQASMGRAGRVDDADAARSSGTLSEKRISGTRIGEDLPKEKA